MPDTVTAPVQSKDPLDRPVLIEREKMAEHHLGPNDPSPIAAEVDLSTFDLVDPELWRRGAYWDIFKRMRDEDPVHWCPDSPLGPYWSVTRYEDIMAVDIDHKRFSSSWEHGGIVLGPPEEDFPLPMFIAMDQPKHDEQRKTVQPAVGPDNLRKYEKLIRERTQLVLDSVPVNEPYD
ncbi:MAG: cytochrome P450, partial [Pseudomonadota bacterium]